MARRWERRGVTVSVGPALPAAADVGFLHVDRTSVPAGVLPLDDSRPIINRHLLDIGKRQVSQLLIGPDDDWPGPVIIKTNWNAAGAKDRRHASERRFSRAWWRRKLAQRWGWHWRWSGYVRRYPVLDRLADVPAWVWRRDDLVVERFMAERDGDAYVMRCWHFLGDAEYGCLLRGSAPVVKASTIIDHAFYQGFPDAIRQVRAALRMDFGKIDYTEVDGQAHVFDVNRTPMVSHEIFPESPCDDLESGLEALVARLRDDPL